MDKKIVSIKDRSLEKAYNDTIDVIADTKFNYNLEYDLRSHELKIFIKDIYDFYVCKKCVYKFNTYYEAYIKSTLYGVAALTNKPTINKNFLIDSIIDNQYLLCPDTMEIKNRNSNEDILFKTGKLLVRKSGD